MPPNSVSARWCKPAALSLRTPGLPFAFAAFQDTCMESPCSSRPECKPFHAPNEPRHRARISLPLLWPTPGHPNFARKSPCYLAVAEPETRRHRAPHSSSSQSQYLPSYSLRRTRESAPVPEVSRWMHCRQENEKYKERPRSVL